MYQRFKRTSRAWQFYGDNTAPGGAPIDESKRTPGSYSDCSNALKKCEHPSISLLKECLKYLDRVGDKKAISILHTLREQNWGSQDLLKLCMDHVIKTRNSNFLNDLKRAVYHQDPSAYLVDCDVRSARQNISK